MSINDRGYPDFDLPDRVTASSPEQLRALADPLRSTLLDLVLERAATINELAAAVDRPKSTVAHHVAVLVEAGLLRVVRTRRVKAIDERFYGRTGRTIVITPTHADASQPATISLLAEAAAEAGGHPDLRCTLRHVRIPAEVADTFWARVMDLADDLTRQTRAGDTVYGFAAGLYPTAQPTLPEPAPEEHHE
jgi:DNA-binding transcriptional ArsR family regulator